MKKYFGNISIFAFLSNSKFSRILHNFSRNKQTSSRKYFVLPFQEMNAFPDEADTVTLSRQMEQFVLLHSTSTLQEDHFEELCTPSTCQNTPQIPPSVLSTSALDDDQEYCDIYLLEKAWIDAGEKYKAMEEKCAEVDKRVSMLQDLVWGRIRANQITDNWYYEFKKNIETLNEEKKKLERNKRSLENDRELLKSILGREVPPFTNDDAEEKELNAKIQALEQELVKNREAYISDDAHVMNATRLDDATREQNVLRPHLHIAEKKVEKIHLFLEMTRNYKEYYQYGKQYPEVQFGEANKYDVAAYIRVNKHYLDQIFSKKTWELEQLRWPFPQYIEYSQDHMENLSLFRTHLGAWVTVAEWHKVWDKLVKERYTQFRDVGLEVVTNFPRFTLSSLLPFVVNK